MGTYTNRYANFVDNNEPRTVPFVKIPVKEEKMTEYHEWLREKLEK